MDQDSKVRVENNGKFEYQSIFSVIQSESPFTNSIMNVSVLLDYNPNFINNKLFLRIIPGSVDAALAINQLCVQLTSVNIEDKILMSISYQR